MNEVHRIRILSNFKEYRKKNLFIDCKFQTQTKTINAHRIILSNYSGIFKSYFCSFENKNTDCYFPIPFDIDELFPKMINFFYKEEIKFDNLTDDPIPFYIMAQVYDVPILQSIYKDIISKNVSLSNILGYIKHYKNLSLDKDIAQSFPGIEKTFNQMINSSLQFAPFIAENFEKFDKKQLFDSCPPLLLSEILKKTNFCDDQKVSIIDEFINENGMPTHDECTLLQDVIDWCADDSYYLLVRHAADWVPPSTSLKSFTTIFDQRRKTIKAMEREIDNIHNGCSNWYLISWLNNIKNSDGYQNLQDSELINFIGTFGGTNIFANPTLYRLVKAISSSSIQVKEFREVLYDKEVFADDKDEHYFLSYPVEGIQYIGYEFDSECCLPKQIIYHPYPNKNYPLNVIIKAYNELGAEVYSSTPVSVKNSLDEVCIETNITTPIKSIRLQMVGNNSGDMNILRASYLHVVGRFVPS